MGKTIRLIPSPVYRPNVELHPPWGASQTRSYLRIHSPRGGVGRLNTNAVNFGRTGNRNKDAFAAQTRQFSGTFRLSHPKSARKPAKKKILVKVTTSIVAAAFIGAIWYSIADHLQIIPTAKVPGEHPVFDDPRFTPFEIVKREQVSETSVVLALRPKRVKGKGVEDPYGKEWDVGTWSVEFKQPELVIAREYTPLPPVPSPKEGEEADLRFLIRKEVGGEMSGYLFGLPEGYILNLRGPKEEYCLKPSSGPWAREVVFLAGGTGIATALQVAHILLNRGEAAKDEEKPRIKILWSNRRTEDRRQSGPVSEAIADLKLNHRGNFDISYLVDEEGTFANAKVIAKAMRTTEPTKPTALHTKTQTHIFMISGPQGYVEHVAGSKKWQDGKEQQGPLGGLLEKMGVKSTRWTVWKL